MAVSPEVTAPAASTRARAPRPRRLVLVGRSYAYWAATYRRTWRGSIVSSVVTPVLFLAAMGLGLGALVDEAQGPEGVEGVSYLTFVAPGLLAAIAMQTAAGESTYPVMGAIKWVRTYHAMIATPLGATEVFLGHLLWVATRVLLAGGIYLAVMVGFGAVTSPLVLLALPAALLVGVAFAAPIMAFAATRDNDAGFAALFRFGIVPLFLFSGTFFPVEQLPGFMQPVAYVTPLWHGVELCRGLALGGLEFGPAAGSVVYLIVWTALGMALARAAYSRRLVK
jgi:lipooligosaccharide transport system permease protein